LTVVRLVRIDHQGTQRCAVEADGRYRLVDGDLLSDPESLRRRAEAAVVSGTPVTPSRLLPPVVPSKIVAIGLNYRDHAAEMGKPLPPEPLMFLKPSTAVIGPEEEIVLPPGAGRVDHEAELGVVIGRRARRVQAASALGYVLGLTCVNDVTARDLQRKDVQYTRAKGFDTFAPVGPCVVLGLDPSALDVECWVNDARRQSSNTRQLIFSVQDIIAFASGVMTLLPGDVIATGTPSGVGPLVDGDRVAVKVQGIGELRNTVTGRGQRLEDN
jgi:2-keto-4-pentenoate hydratase/2-oxohepta-3-ene-1,7-dioic acid hydratase in catechol pathway